MWFIAGLLIGGLSTYAYFLHRSLLARQEPDKTVLQQTQKILHAEPKKVYGEFIKVNKVESYLKEATGDVALGDIIEDGEN